MTVRFKVFKSLRFDIKDHRKQKHGAVADQVFSVYICIFMYIHIYFTCIYYVHIHIHTCLHVMYIYIHTHIFIHIYILCIYVHTYIHIYVCVWVCVCLCVYIKIRAMLSFEGFFQNLNQEIASSCCTNNATKIIFSLEEVPMFSSYDFYRQ